MFLPLPSLSVVLFALPGGERLPREPALHVVSGVGDLRAGALRPAEGAQGDVGSQDQEEQDHSLRARV